MSENQRRKFLKTVATGAGAALLLGKSEQLFAEPAKKEKENKDLGELVKESDPLPKGLGYLHDATKATRPDKAGTKGDSQLCLNCQFYTKSGEKDGEEVGKCQLFPKGLVKGKGWCKSWIKKA